MDCTPTTNNLLPSYTHKHTLPAFILLSDHTRISVHFLPFASASLLPPLHERLLWTNSSIKGVFPPWSTKFGVFLRLSCSVLSSEQSLPVWGFTTRNTWSGRSQTKKHSLSHSCHLLIIRKNECVVALAFQPGLWNPCPLVDVRLGWLSFCLWVRLKCAGTGMYFLCAGLDPAARMSFPAL